ncbi:11937_t:CDS:2 [Entrophospora sp. SA101]|nr:11937_t:CDS:2 [Entrophospora sp. SA101]
MPMLANAILEKSVMESDGFNIIRQEDTKYKEYFATYKEIKSAGIINLESADNDSIYQSTTTSLLAGLGSF